VNAKFAEFHESELRRISILSTSVNRPLARCDKLLRLASS
jgi:hypothetical protein